MSWSTLRRRRRKKAFHLGHSKKVILVIGGSQGAVRINELVFGLKKDYSDELKNVGIIWSTGDFSYQNYKEKMNNEIDEGSDLPVTLHRQGGPGVPGGRHGHMPAPARA